MDPLKNLAKKGLYSPEQEHDACGVGVVANIKGQKTHQIIEEGVQVLINLGHRGAAGRDPDTGDGAGMLIQTPSKLFEREAVALGIDLPAAGEYGVGMVFLPPEVQTECRSLINKVVEAEGLEVLGWRDVPIDLTKIGVDARDACPHIAQVFIGPGVGIKDASHLERKLFIVRKVLENSMGESGLNDDQADCFYICSMSCNTIVYKGLLMAHQIAEFYLDLQDEDLASAFSLVHSRFSTNTMGSWRLAHPYRYLAHNGEINTLRGNVNWMHARESQFESSLFGIDVAKIAPVTKPGDSDTASLDNALELLQMTGRDLDHALLMLIPEAWNQHETMTQEKRDFYEYHSSFMEPWDGPAMIVSSDGSDICALLDRNGLRPFRYLVTNEDKLVMASETGVLEVPPADVKYKGRLQPGRMFLVSLQEGRIIGDEELKSKLANRNPYGQWLKDNKLTLGDLPEVAEASRMDASELVQLQQAFGYTIEEIRMLTSVMAQQGTEAIGSMGNDAPLAVLSDQNQIVFNYFKQLFAQVTNPPLDAIREELVTSLGTFIGSEQNLFEETPKHCRQLWLESPILSDEELAQIKNLNQDGIRTVTLSALYDRDAGEGALKTALDGLREQTSQNIASGCSIIVLSDRGSDRRWAPIPSLLAVSAVHHHLIREGTRTKVGLILETGDPREVHHFALLIGYGAGAVNPYLALATVRDLAQRGQLNGTNQDYAQKGLIKASEKGVLKVMSKMGISTVQSYRGAQIFEAIGLNQDLINEYFTGTSSRVGGIGLDGIQREATERHEMAFGAPHIAAKRDLQQGGFYQWRRGEEHHQWNPESISKLQYAARNNNWDAYKEFSRISDDETRKLANLRGLLDFKKNLTPVPIGEVEPASEIVKRFATGAASL